LFLGGYFRGGFSFWPSAIIRSPSLIRLCVSGIIADSFVRDPRKQTESIRTNEIYIHSLTEERMGEAVGLFAAGLFIVTQPTALSLLLEGSVRPFDQTKRDE